MPQPSDVEATFEINERLYPLEAVQNAIYTYTDRAYVRVKPAGPGRLTVVMTFKPAAAPVEREELRGEFDNELGRRTRCADAHVAAVAREEGLARGDHPSVGAGGSGVVGRQRDVLRAQFARAQEEEAENQPRPQDARFVRDTQMQVNSAFHDRC